MKLINPENAFVAIVICLILYFTVGEIHASEGARTCYADSEVFADIHSLQLKGARYAEWEAYNLTKLAQGVLTPEDVHHNLNMWKSAERVPVTFSEAQAALYWQRMYCEPMLR